jgi:hypothetical protein
VVKIKCISVAVHMCNNKLFSTTTMSAPVQSPGFDDTWTHWDDSQQRRSKESTHHAQPSGGQASTIETIEISQELDPWAAEPSRNELGRRVVYRDGATIGG